MKPAEYCLMTGPSAMTLTYNPVHASSLAIDPAFAATAPACDCRLVDAGVDDVHGERVHDGNCGHDACRARLRHNDASVDFPA